MRASKASLLVLALWLAGCAAERPAPSTRGLEIQVAPLELVGIGDACFDLRVTRGPGGGGELVWERGTPGLNQGTRDPGAICSDRFGDGAGDITYVGPCDASDDGVNSVSLWFDGLYDQDGDYLPPDGAPDGPDRVGGWQDPCPGGCTLEVVCRPNADTPVRFDFTVMRDAQQGFFDVAVAFEDIFCSAKLDTCYENDVPMKLLFGADGERDWTAVFGLACTAGTNTVATTLHYGDLAVVCTSGITTTVFPLNPVGDTGNNSSTVGDHTVRYGVYRGTEDLSCDEVGTPEVESCNKVFWNLAISLDDLAPLGTCTLAFSATATDGGRGFANGLPVGTGVSYPFIDVTATLAPPTCQRHALNGGGAVRTAYRGDLNGQAPVILCSSFDGVEAGPVVGADCSDSCPNDPDKTLPGLCGCGAADTDGDGDLSPDCFDACPADTNKTEPGACGCGSSDDDRDADTVPDCLDLCPDDASKIETGDCGCGTPDTDGDGDAIPDCFDGCPNDIDKTEPGACGCGTSDDDGDGDTVPDCLDVCPADPDKTVPGLCGCGTADTNGDGDLVPDCLDLCPEDPSKIEAGVCGCGTADTDGDGDLAPDCIDSCPADMNKTQPGICGCGTPETDGDGDLTPDCIDTCPADPNKTVPGTCGCGTPETDGDGDLTPDCNDACPADVNKTEPGLCGCGTSDADSDGDLTADCLDGCVLDPLKTEPGACGCGVGDDVNTMVGGSQGTPASSCVAIDEAGASCGDRLYWIDPNGGDTTDAFQAFCDMTTDDGGWMKVESATYPFWFSDANWTNHNAADPLAANYSILGKRTAFIDAGGCYEYRLQVGNSGNWQSTQAHEIIWRQCHDPFTQTTNGSDYTYLSGEQPTTCGGFNGLHHKYQTHSYSADPDSADNVNCWWMQIVPKQQYGTSTSHPGYLEGFGGSGNVHTWQSLWIRAAGTGQGREAPGASCATLLADGYTTDGDYWIDTDGGSNSDAFLAYCDMTNGGWTRVIGPTTTLAQLQALPVTTNTITSFLNDATYGVSWGTFTTVSTWGTEPHRLVLDLRFDSVKVVHSGFYNSPAAGLGEMTIRSQNRNIISSGDGHTDASSGQTLVVGNTTIFNGATTNISNRSDTVAAAGGTSLIIAMNAYTSAYTYTRRYIRELWFR